MTQDEWDEITVVMLAYWPNKDIPSESFDVWFNDLSEFESEKVEAAVIALGRDGREWMPNGGQVRAKIVELSQARSDWGAVWNLILEACRSHGGAEYGGWSWLKEQDPLAADAVGEHSWHSFCLSDDPMTTKESQVRRRWEELKGSADRHERYRGIPSGGLKALEGSGPRRFGELVALDKGEEAA